MLEALHQAVDKSVLDMRRPEPHNGQAKTANGEIDMTEFALRFCGIFMGNKSQALELRKVESGGYLEGNDEDAAELAKDLLAAGEPVSQWAIWDNRTTAPKTRQAVPYTAAQFKALIRGEDFALVWCKRGQFRAPVLKIGQIDAKTSTGKRAAPVRFGK